MIINDTQLHCHTDGSNLRMRDCIIKTKDLIDYAVSLGLNAEFYNTKAEIKEVLCKIAKPGDRIVIMGARDNSLPVFCQQIIDDINSTIGEK